MNTDQETTNIQNEDEYRFNLHELKVNLERFSYTLGEYKRFEVADGYSKMDIYMPHFPVSSSKDIFTIQDLVNNFCKNLFKLSDCPFKNGEYDLSEQESNGGE